MKKTIILSAAALGLFAASCAKSRTCTCTATVSEIAFTDYTSPALNDNTTTDAYSVSSTETIDKLKKKDAARKSGCFGGTSEEKTITTGGSGSAGYTKTVTRTTTSDCKLK